MPFCPPNVTCITVGACPEPNRTRTDPPTVLQSHRCVFSAPRVTRRGAAKSRLSPLVSRATRRWPIRTDSPWRYHPTCPRERGPRGAASRGSAAKGWPRRLSCPPHLGDANLAPPQTRVIHSHHTVLVRQLPRSVWVGPANAPMPILRTGVGRHAASVSSSSASLAARATTRCLPVLGPHTSHRQVTVKPERRTQGGRGRWGSGSSLPPRQSALVGCPEFRANLLREIRWPLDGGE